MCCIFFCGHGWGIRPSIAQRASRALCFLSRPRSGVESNLFSSLSLTLDKSLGFSAGDKRKAKTTNLLAGAWPINAWRYAEHQHNIHLRSCMLCAKLSRNISFTTPVHRRVYNIWHVLMFLIRNQYKTS